MSEARSFGRYRVTSTLGAGAMGEVFAAIDDVLGREVAVKILKGHRNGLAARMLDDRFRQEARAIAALSHPGVVQVFDIDLNADPPYLVMERVAGPSLKERLAEGALTTHDLRALGIQIGRALAAAHAQKIIHRDVKPANILAAGPGTWKLADFGVAHVPDSSITMTGQFVGSPAYAPPEALVRGQCDAEGDVFGLGASLYQAAAGSWPRLEATTGGLLAPVPPIRGLVPELPEDIAAIIDRACAVDAVARPTATELADALAGASSSPGAESIVGTHIASNAAPSSAPRAASNADSMAGSDPASVAGAIAFAGATAAALPPPPPATHAPVRWQPWAIGGAAVLVIAILAAKCSGPDHAPSVPAPSAGPTMPPPSTPPPDEIRIETPVMRDGKASKDWRKVIENVQDGN
jgi:serine/threonine-protein kinase